VPTGPTPSSPPPAEPFETENVRGRLHKAAAGRGDGMVLTHGAGGNCETPLLIAVSEAFQVAGVTVLRCDLPFRQRKPKGPPGPADAARDRAGLKSAIAALRQIVSGAMTLSGVSYGGRQASILAANEPELADALALFSYPLHPPGKPTELRTAHFAKLRTPALFVQGASDPFGSIREMEDSLRAIVAPHVLLVVEGAGHDLKRGRLDLDPVLEAYRSLAVSRDGAG
jgi:predicted alpha/beta-hydrolase family hydrolase